MLRSGRFGVGCPFFVLVLLVCAVAATACADGEGALPAYRPAPIVDDGDGAALARALRARNRAVAAEGDVAAASAEVRARLAALKGRELDPAIGWLLAAIEQRLDERPLGWIDGSLAAAVVGRLRVADRGVVRVFYGDITQHEIERERPFVAALEVAVGLRGYRLEVDEQATTSIWYERMRARDTAAFLWRSEGWFSRPPWAADGRDVVTRVWTADTADEPKQVIFADSWAGALPEGLAWQVLASCGTGGPFLEDELNLLDDLGAAADLVLRTFLTETGDHAVFTRVYSGLLATSGYSFDDATWRAAIRLLPDRSGVSPELVAAAEARLLDMCEHGDRQWFASAILDELPNEVWLPRLVDRFETATGSARSELGGTLHFRSGSFAGTPRSFDTAAEWRAWWSSADVVAIREREAAWAEASPDEDIVLSVLLDAFVAHTGYAPLPGQGVQVASNCWRSWLRHLHGELRPVGIEGEGEAATLVLEAVSTQDRAAAPALPLSVRWRSSDRTLTHNLEAVIDATGEAAIVTHCQNM